MVQVGATQSQVWVEKYRPHTLEDICGQDHVVSSLKGYLKTNSMPHLLFYGAAGTGKTSTILAYVKQFYSQYSKSYKDYVLELNASDERGIQVVREKVKLFARQTCKDVPYKVIILDEFDAMTMDAQAALRRIMEDYVSVTRFCLICNYAGKIIDPIKSRCAQFQFKGLDEEDIRSKLEQICNDEGLKIGKKDVLKIVNFCEGDMRRCVYALQTLHQLNTTNVEDILGIVPTDWVEELWSLLKSNDFVKVMGCVDDIIMEGYGASNVLNQLFDMLTIDMDMLEDKKSSLAMVFGEYSEKITVGNGKIQLLGALSKCHSILK
eukprot:NODE_74_length_23402_cov_1.166974.p5 type:complete len:321 gc:universal NODE_74_length_23402_cov_1.166974:20736-19774(-)